MTTRTYLYFACILVLTVQATTQLPPQAVQPLTAAPVQAQPQALIQPAAQPRIAQKVVVPPSKASLQPQTRIKLKKIVVKGGARKPVAAAAAAKVSPAAAAAAAKVSPAAASKRPAAASAKLSVAAGRPKVAGAVAGAVAPKMLVNGRPVVTSRTVGPAARGVLRKGASAVSALSTLRKAQKKIGLNSVSAKYIAQLLYKLEKRAKASDLLAKNSRKAAMMIYAKIIKQRKWAAAGLKTVETFINLNLKKSTSLLAAVAKQAGIRLKAKVVKRKIVVKGPAVVRKVVKKIVKPIVRVKIVGKPSKKAKKGKKIAKKAKKAIKKAKKAIKKAVKKTAKKGKKVVLKIKAKKPKKLRLLSKVVRRLAAPFVQNRRLAIAVAKQSRKALLALRRKLRAQLRRLNHEKSANADNKQLMSSFLKPVQAQSERTLQKKEDLMKQMKEARAKALKSAAIAMKLKKQLGLAKGVKGTLKISLKSSGKHIKKIHNFMKAFKFGKFSMKRMTWTLTQLSKLWITAQRGLKSAMASRKTIFAEVQTARAATRKFLLSVSGNIPKPVKVVKNIRKTIIARPKVVRPKVKVVRKKIVKKVLVPLKKKVALKLKVKAKGKAKAKGKKVVIKIKSKGKGKKKQLKKK